MIIEMFDLEVTDVVRNDAGEVVLVALGEPDPTPPEDTDADRD